jgi:hypothetical protein
MAQHWSTRMACHLCDKSFRTYQAEAYHRHNAQFICKGYKRTEQHDAHVWTWLAERYMVHHGLKATP